jgi:hypothetical protein
VQHHLTRSNALADQPDAERRLDANSASAICEPADARQLKPPFSGIAEVRSPETAARP